MHVTRRSSATSQLLASVGDDANRKLSRTYTPSKEAIKSGTIGSVCTAPSGLRRILQLGEGVTGCNGATVYTNGDALRI